jgi:transcription-repair coupling factor (superfamily II helicase)
LLIGLELCTACRNIPYGSSRFVYAPKKVIVRGLGTVKPQKQLNDLIDWLGTIHKALPELELV